MLVEWREEEGRREMILNDESAQERSREARKGEEGAEERRTEERREKEERSREQRREQRRGAESREEQRAEERSREQREEQRREVMIPTIKSEEEGREEMRKYFFIHKAKSRFSVLQIKSFCLAFNKGNHITFQSGDSLYIFIRDVKTHPAIDRWQAEF